MGVGAKRPRFITPEGLARIREEYDQLFGVERPKLTELIAWAAGNGDRSENGDYIYGRKKLREIDRRLGYLSKVMKEAKLVDPAKAERRDEVRFGATVTLVDENDRERIITIVGNDEAEAGDGRVGWSAPITRALIGAKVGDERAVRLPSGEMFYEVVKIDYPSA
ncbi:GreA/GreB family elongation factor [Sphingomicrobium sediminis]|uniref:Transcription elongation factor GreB n=1 Tax=Sphingomicrobium sediminis TaxID=2950949 RepID=A0A9X2EFD3_9SPHN|nr:GreA/GreB family elongation factor [Sphingomicrobium sediminis]MCM8556950.1 GreA/GreB family elongation factor [Sphingomicrobium sediminis]